MANARALTSASFMYGSRSGFSCTTSCLACSGRDLRGMGRWPARKQHVQAKGAPARWDKKSALTTGVIVSCLGGSYLEPVDLAGVAAPSAAHPGLRHNWGRLRSAWWRRNAVQGANLRSFLLQLVTGAFFVSQTLSERGIPNSVAAHLRGRTDRPRRARRRDSRPRQRQTVAAGREQVLHSREACGASVRASGRGEAAPDTKKGRRPTA